MLLNTIRKTEHSAPTHILMASWCDLALVTWVAEQRPECAAAYNELVSRYRSWILKRCQFRLGNAVDAEDVTQEVIIRAHKNLHKLLDRAQFKAWLRTIVDNSCNTFFVRRSRYTTSEHIEQLIEVQEQGYANSPQEILAETEAVHYVLSSLPVNARQVIKLRFLNDYSLEEISQRLNLSLSATKARLYRAIEQFKGIYEENFGDCHSYIAV